MTAPIEELARRLRAITVGLGVFGVVAGAVLLAWPAATVTVLAALLGVHFLAGGILTLVGAVAGPDGERALGAFAALASIVAGVLTLARPMQAAALILTVAAAFWVIRGVADLVALLTDSGAGSRLARVLGGFVSLAAGVVALSWPDATLTVLVRIAGCWMILLGLSRIAAGRSIGRV